MRIKTLFKIGLLFYVFAVLAYVVTLVTAPSGYPWRDDMISRPPWFDEAYVSDYFVFGFSVTALLFSTGVVLSLFSGMIFMFDGKEG